jgi:hypothetical protein
MDRDYERDVRSWIEGSFKHPVNVRATPTRWISAVEQVVKEVGRLRADWAGEGSKAPTREVLRDLEQVACYLLPAKVRRPEVEVDVDDGFVTLVWMSGDRKRMFSLNFHGMGSVIGSYTSIENAESDYSWKHPVGEEARIFAALDSERIRALLAD